MEFRFTMKILKVTTLLISLLLLGCANSNSCTVSSTNCSDPLEGFNRAMFNFNYHILDPYVLKPTAVFWKNYVPFPLRKGLTNFSANLSEPASMINSLVIGEPKLAAIHFTRFFLNTTIGLGGLMDVASLADSQLRVTERRFGSVLGNYNVPYGPYVVLPGYGSATLREEGGNWVDTLYPVLSFIAFWPGVAKWAVEGIENRALFLDYENIIKNSDDPYRLTFEAYFQRKNFLANGGIITPSATMNNEDMNQIFDEIDQEE